MAFVFLSHADRDKQLPEFQRLVARLVSEKIPLWIDRPEDIPIENYGGVVGRLTTGKDFVPQIESALDRASIVLFVLSENSNAGDRSDLLIREYKHGERNNKLCIVKINSIASINPFYRAVQVLDFSSASDEATIESRWQQLIFELRNPYRGYFDGKMMAPGQVINEESLIPEMVVLPVQSFRMGSPLSEDGQRSAERPQRDISFNYSFAIGKYPVTFEQYDYYCERTDAGKPDAANWGRGRRPVINISWVDARTYCQWLSGETRALYKLPSEAEWEYACRAGSATPFSCGETILESQARFNEFSSSNEKKRRIGSDLTGTLPVGTFPPNSFGLHDMHGNVWEWCEDFWRKNYRHLPTDGSAWLEGNPADGRVVRGGSWHCAADKLRSATRDKNKPGLRFNDVGFRVLLRLPRR